MPLYECVYWMGVRHPLEVVNRVIHHNASFVVNRGGVIRRLENMGCTQLAYPMKRHHETHLWGRLVLMLFDGNPTAVNEVRESLRHDSTVFRWVFYKTKDPFRPLYDERKYLTVQNLPTHLKKSTIENRPQVLKQLKEPLEKLNRLEFKSNFALQSDHLLSKVTQLMPHLGFKRSAADTAALFTSIANIDDVDVDAELEYDIDIDTDVSNDSALLGTSSDRSHTVKPVGIPELSSSFPRTTLDDEFLPQYQVSELSEELLRSLADVLPQEKKD